VFAPGEVLSGDCDFVCGFCDYPPSPPAAPPEWPPRPPLAPPQTLLHAPRDQAQHGPAVGVRVGVVAGAVGGLCVLLLACGVLCVKCYRRRQQRKAVARRRTGSVEFASRTHVSLSGSSAVPAAAVAVTTTPDVPSTVPAPGAIPAPHRLPPVHLGGSDGAVGARPMGSGAFSSTSPFAIKRSRARCAPGGAADTRSEARAGCSSVPYSLPVGADGGSVDEDGGLASKLDLPLAEPLEPDGELGEYADDEFETEGPSPARGSTSSSPSSRPPHRFATPGRRGQVPDYRLAAGGSSTDSLPVTDIEKSVGAVSLHYV
jgi:hypothetical protein